MCVRSVCDIMYNRQVCTCVEFVADGCADTVNSVVVTLKKESVHYFNSMSFPVDCPVLEENSINILFKKTITK